jgi:uncharacterized membrane protein
MELEVNIQYKMTKFGISVVKYCFLNILVTIIIINTNTATFPTITEGILGIIIVNTEKYKILLTKKTHLTSW